MLTMVDVFRKRCSHDACTKIPCFNVEGSRTPAYCKQHAKDGMVDITNKRCSHDSCTRRPSFNAEGSRTAAFCKRHAEDGMVNVRTRHCSHVSCTKKPFVHVGGSKTAVYCKQHAEDDMVDITHKRCSHSSCTRPPSFIAEGSGSAAFCRKHAQAGMVNVRTCRFSNVSRRAAPGRGVPNDVEKSASTILNTDLLDDSSIHVRKRSRCARHGTPPPRPLGHGPLKGGIVENTTMGSSNHGSHGLSSRAFRSEVTDDTAVTADKRTGHITSERLLPLQDKPHPEKAIKTETELLFFF